MRFKHIDALRGIAALMVTFFHITCGTDFTKTTASYGHLGYLGVEIFFVITGFVLPYSMYRSNFELKNFGVFMLKRIIRIYPAYILAVGLSVALALVTHRYHISHKALAAHLFLLNDILHLTFISPVFWTLSIEFQFYLLVGLIYPALTNNKTSIATIAVLSLISYFIKSPAYIFHWFPYFGMGILIFNKQITKLNRSTFYIITITIISFTVFKDDHYKAIAAAFAILFIDLVKMERKHYFNKIMIWLGTISYSLYLTHSDFGRTAIAVFRHKIAHQPPELFLVFIGMIVSIAAGYCYYRLIEKPSVEYGSLIKIEKTKRNDAALT